MRARIAALAAFVLLSSCARNPVSGLPELVLMSSERERELGAEQEKEFVAELGLSDHAATASWVEAIGARLAVHSPRQDVDYRFHVADMEVPNAFALPGGPVFVTRGLLALVRSEDELAGVIGHEIGHVAARHSVRQTTAATPLALVFGVPAAIVSSVSRPLGTLVGLPGAIVSGLALSAYGREQEYEADELGERLALAAGFRPVALAEFLERLEREEALHRDGPPPLSFFSSHPRTPDRTRRARELAEELAPHARPRSVADQNVALAHLDGLLVGESPAHGVFVEDDFFHPDLGFAFRVPKGWDRENRPEAVVAADPAAEGRVAILLELSAQGDDPAQAAASELSSEEHRRALQTFELNGRPAAQLEVGSGSDAAVLTWVALGGRVYRIVGVYPIAEAQDRRALIAAAVQSLRPLTTEDRARVRAERLRIRSAQPGETLDALIARSRSVWSAEQVAVANDLAEGVPLQAGARLKLAVAERWKPAR
jgi:predicted Zn-dependent protease